MIHEGQNRQIRRMSEEVGHRVIRLVRVRIGPIVDRSLPPGEWRHLTAAEVKSLIEAISKYVDDTIVLWLRRDATFLGLVLSEGLSPRR